MSMRKMLAGCALALMLLATATGSGWAARAGGTLNFVVPYGGDVFSLDPHKTSNTNDHIVTINIHRSLYRWDDEKNRPKLELGDKVDISADAMVYRIALKKGVKFHNGRQMTADDVIWSYERIMNAKTASPSARFVRIIKGAKDFEDGKAPLIAGLRKLDDFSLEITMDRPVDPAYTLYEGGTAILPKEEVEKKGDAFGVEPVGLGPFKFVKWVKGSEIVIAKSPDYYEKGKPYLDKVVYKVMPEGAARDAAFRAKELDATVVGSAQYPVYKADPQIAKNMVEVAELFTRIIGFNPNYEPFKKKEVRQALNHAIDSKLIIQRLLKEKAYSAVGYLPSTSPAFDPNAKGYEYNPEKAKALMKQAGYEKGFTFECMGTSNESWGIPVIEAIMPFLRAINVTVKPQQLEGAALSARMQKLDYQAFIWSLSSGAGGDSLQALARFESTNPPTAGNSVAYNNPAFDKLLDAARKERDVAKRNEIVRKADALFKEDAPFWFFNYNKAVVAHQPWVHGIRPVAIEMMYQDLTDLWIDDASPRAKEK
jgi:peptide/nickel transport system substrate-binding protein